VVTFDHTFIAERHYIWIHTSTMSFSSTSGENVLKLEQLHLIFHDVAVPSSSKLASLSRT